MLSGILIAILILCLETLFVNCLILTALLVKSTLSVSIRFMSRFSSSIQLNLTFYKERNLIVDELSI